MKLDRAKRTSKPKTNLSAAHAKQPNTTESRAQTNQNRNAKKTAYTAAFWCPKERWKWTMSSPTSQNHPSEKVSKKVSNVAFWRPTKRRRKASATARQRLTGSCGTGTEIWQYGSFTLQKDEEGPAQAARRGTERSKARLLWRAPPETTGSADTLISLHQGMIDPSASISTLRPTSFSTLGPLPQKILDISEFYSEQSHSHFRGPTKVLNSLEISN